MTSENDPNVFEVDLKEVETEYLSRMTDQYVIRVITALYGRDELVRLDEANLARIVACEVSQRFLEMMYELAGRTMERKSVVDYLNSLL